MKNWLKFGLILGWLSLIPAIYCFTTDYHYLESNFLTPVATPVFVLISFFMYLTGMALSQATLDNLFTMGLYLSVIFWFLIGAVIGLIYDKFKRYNELCK